MSDSTAPSDSAKVKSLVAPAMAASSPPPTVKDTMPEAPHLAGGDVIAGVRGQARVVNTLDGGVRA